jgi:GNAT superfamily N-acetyltransferase
MTTDQARIRPVTPSDGETILTMVLALSAQERQAPPRFTVERFRPHAFGPDAVYRTFIAEVGDTPIGMVAFHGGFSSQNGEAGLHVVDLYVAAPWRRRGIGRELMAAVAREARRLDGHWVAWMVRRDNPLALEFYRGLGGIDDDVTMFVRGETFERLVAG